MATLLLTKTIPFNNYSTNIVFLLRFFLGHLSSIIRNNITKLIKSHYPGIKLQLVYKARKRASSIFKYKDFFQPLVCANAIYSPHVVAPMPLMARYSEILRFTVMSTVGF